MNQASLSFLIPLYFKGKKIESGPLFEKLQKLSPSFCEFTIDCFTIENSPFGKNIFVAGFFPFKPKIFIEKSILSELITSDFEAIFAHELSHIRLNHLKERNSLLIKTLGITIFFTSCILMGLYLMGLVDRLETAAVLSTFIPILFCQIGNKNLIVEQEFEADTLATLVIKHGPEKLTSALTKMIQIQKTEPSEFMKKRIERLAA